jgi:hypothetical protein
MERDIDRVIAAIQKRVPDMECEQLVVKYPGADDDGLWFFKLPARGTRVQVESWNGMCPLLVEGETEAARITAATVEEATEMVVAWLAP